MLTSRFARSLLLSCLILSPGPAADGRTPPPARTGPDAADPAGDALPPGAIARIRDPKPNAKAAVRTLGPTPDGRWLMAAVDGPEVRVWDRSTGKPFGPFTVTPRGSANGLYLSPDGRRLAAWVLPGPTRAMLYVWDVDTGRERLCRDIHDLQVWSFGLSPDGRVVVLGEGKQVRLWDVETGREDRLLSGLDGPVAGIDPHAGDVLVLTFSPDGRRLAAGHRSGVVRVWDAAAGRLVRRLDPPSNSGTYYAVCSLRFSRDGGLLACGQNSRVVVWDAATWAVVAQLGDHAGAVFDLAFSTDGRALATGCHDGRVRLWEVASWQKREEYEGHREWAVSVAFSPDGRAVKSDSNGEAILWDVTGLATGRFRPPAPLTPSALEHLWDDLHGADAARAYRAVCTLAAVPDQSVPWINERVRPATRGVAWAGPLVADLGSEDFEVREAATAALAELGRTARPALRRALADSPSAEVHRRAAGLLERLGRGSPSPASLANLRAVETLEIVGSAEARAVLRVLAGGAPGADLTRDARASLDRLAGRR